jgi:hypothetical protein
MRYDFIEIGTCDFTTLLQSCKDEESGLSIEAIPEYLDRLPNRANVKKLNAVVSNSSGEDIIYTLPEKKVNDYNLPNWLRGCSRLGSPHPFVLRELEERNLQHLYEEIRVRTITIGEIIEEYSITEIGIFKTDLEGIDIDIINSLLDYGKVLPDKIAFEYCEGHYVHDASEDFNKLKNRLISLGYRLTSDIVENFIFERGVNISVVSMYDEGYSRMADHTINSNFKDYCQLNGYNHIGFRIDDDFLEGRNPQWGKIKALRQLIEKGESEWFFFIDCDCLIMNHSIKLESFIQEDKFIILPKGGGAPDNNLTGSPYTDNIMSSQILIKNCQESLDFLAEIWESPDWPEGMDINEFDHEMRQIRISSKKDRWRDGIGLVEEKLFNRFWPTKNPYMIDTFPHLNKNLWEPGDFIAHVTSYSKNERIEIISLLKPFVGGKIGKWELDGDRIYYKSLVDSLGDITLVLYRGYDQILKWDSINVDRTLLYWISSNNFQNNDVIRVFDSSQKEIALYQIKK